MSETGKRISITMDLDHPYATTSHMRTTFSSACRETSPDSIVRSCDADLALTTYHADFSNTQQSLANFIEKLEEGGRYFDLTVTTYTKGIDDSATLIKQGNFSDFDPKF